MSIATPYLAVYRKVAVTGDYNNFLCAVFSLVPLDDPNGEMVEQFARNLKAEGFVVNIVPLEDPRDVEITLTDKEIEIMKRHE